jgi:hypothetical protein
MDKLYRTYFTKRFFRNLAAISFLLVLAVEHSSHSFSLGDHHIDVSSSTVDSRAFGVSSADKSKTGVSFARSQTSSHDHPVCQDEVSHHVLLISIFEFSFERNDDCGANCYAFLFSDPLFRSPSPPFSPPKFS